MKFASKIKAAAFTAILTLSTSAAFAEDLDADDTFYSFYQTIAGWINGPLGTGLALMMLLMGAGIGVAKNSPMPALSGVAGAAFLHWGPGIIVDLTSKGMLI